jgi:putative sigma-54 modulation protein
MKTSITFRQIQPTPAIKEFTEERLTKLDRIGKYSKESHVILSTERYLHIAEILFSQKDFKFTATASTDDMYASIEEAATRLEKALRRHHDKVTKKKGRGSASVSP